MKLGVWVGPRDDSVTEWMVYAGAGVPVGQRWRVSPTVFYSRTGVGAADQWRALLAVDYDLGAGKTLFGGVAGGKDAAGTHSGLNSA